MGRAEKMEQQQAEKVVVVVTEAQGSKNGLAAALSIVPGLGHIYKSRVIIGLTWMFFTGVGYAALFLPGLFLHVICIFHALSIKAK